jgi:hypothetical protein
MNEMLNWLVRPWALEISKPFAKHMHSFRYLYLNQYHLEFLCKPFQNDVGQPWMNSPNLNVNCYNDINNLHLCMFIIQATTTSFSSIRKPNG